MDRERLVTLALVVVGTFLALASGLYAMEARACTMDGDADACTRARDAALMVHVTAASAASLVLARAAHRIVEPVVFCGIPVAGFAVSTWTAGSFAAWAPAFLPVEVAIVLTPPFLASGIALAALSMASTPPEPRRVFRDTAMAVITVGGVTLAAWALASAGPVAVADRLLAAGPGVLAAALGFHGLPAPKP